MTDPETRKEGDADAPGASWVRRDATPPPVAQDEAAGGERCPTCGSDDPAKCNLGDAGPHDHSPNRCCTDPFHTPKEER